MRSKSWLHPGSAGLKDTLEFLGYTVIFTGLGAKALDLAREHLPDLILLDIRLPDISGIEAARLLKADGQAHAIPIIAVTALAMPGDRAVILDRGVMSTSPSHSIF